MGTSTNGTPKKQRLRSKPLRPRLPGSLSRRRSLKGSRLRMSFLSTTSNTMPRSANDTGPALPAKSPSMTNGGSGLPPLCWSSPSPSSPASCESIASSIAAATAYHKPHPIIKQVWPSNKPGHQTSPVIKPIWSSNKNNNIVTSRITLRASLQRGSFSFVNHHLSGGNDMPT